jgi:hypothetical protein
VTNSGISAAARGVRSKENQWLRNLVDYEEAGLISNRHECHHNDVGGEIFADSTEEIAP